MYSKIKLALPKGRFLNNSLAILKKFGCKQINPGILHVKLMKECVEVYLLNAADIPKLVSSGKIECGISTDEWCLELEHTNGKEKEFNVLRKLNWISTELAFFSKPDFCWPPKNEVKIATSFPFIAHHILEKYNISKYEILFLNGSIEACVPNIAHIGLDCVETGQTLKAHGLQKIYVPFTKLGMSFIVNKSFDVLSHNHLIDPLVNVMNSIDKEFILS